MSKGKTGRPRGRPPASRAALRLHRDSLAIALSGAVPGMTGADAARLANRIADPTATFEIGRDRLILETRKRGGVPSNVDRYTQQRLSAKDNRFAYTAAEAEAVSTLAGPALAVLGSNHKSIALSQVQPLVAAGWPDEIARRLLIVAAFLHGSNAAWFSDDPSQVADGKAPAR